MTKQIEQATQFLQAGDLAQAQQAFEAALALEPNSAVANLGLATVFNRTGRVLHARQILEAMLQQLLQLPPDQAPVRLRAEVLAQLGLSLEGMQQLPEAAQRYEEALKLVPSKMLRQRLENLEPRIALRAAPPSMLQAVARFHLKHGNWAEAVRVYKALLYYDANDEISLYGLAALLCQRQVLPQAMELIQRALNRSPDNPDYLKVLADIYVQQAEIAKGITLYKHALTIKPDHLGTLRALSDTLLLNSQPEEAARYRAAAEALDDGPAEPEGVGELVDPKLAKLLDIPEPTEAELLQEEQLQAEMEAELEAELRGEEAPQEEAPKARTTIRRKPRRRVTPAVKAKPAKAKATPKAKTKVKTKAKAKPVKATATAKTKVKAKSKIQATTKAKAKAKAPAKVKAPAKARPAPVKTKAKVKPAPAKTKAKAPVRKAAPKTTAKTRKATAKVAPQKAPTRKTAPKAKAAPKTRAPARKTRVAAKAKARRVRR